MKKSLIVIGLIIILLIGGGIFLFMQSSQKSSSENNSTTPSANIEIRSFAFVPSEITINVGNTLTWVNNDLVPHTITSDSGTELNSPTLSKGKTFSYTFNTAGTYEYHCSIHSSMKGKIIVE